MFKIDTEGTIKSGVYKDWKIKIQDDKENTGGYLVLYYNKNNPKVGYDDWVEKYEYLEGYFKEQDFIIDWDK